MNRPLIERWTDTTVFRFVLFFSGVLVMPVLALGVLTTVIGGTLLVIEPSAIELEQAMFGLLSAGGALGVVGYARAHLGVRNPHRHNVTATLLCLAAGILTALAVAGYAMFGTFAASRSPWETPAWVAVTTLFAAANVVWAVAGIAWLQRLPRRYAERTGAAFDGVPALFLFVAVALATAAMAIATTL
jgi:hypothetical protein